MCRVYPGAFRQNNVLVDWEGKNPFLDCELLDEILKDEYKIRTKIDWKARGDEGYEKTNYPAYRKIECIDVADVRNLFEVVASK